MRFKVKLLVVVWGEAYVQQFTPLALQTGQQVYKLLQQLSDAH